MKWYRLKQNGRDAYGPVYDVQWRNDASKYPDRWHKFAGRPLCWAAACERFEKYAPIREVQEHFVGTF